MKTLICFLAFAASLAAQTYVDAAFPWPMYRGVAAGSNLSMGSSEMIGVTFTAKKACSVRTVHFNLPTVTTAQSMTVTLQDPDASGFPDGTADQTGTLATPATGFRSVTMNADRTMAAGDRASVRFEWTSTAGAVTFATTDGSTFWLNPQRVGFSSKYSSSAWATTANPPAIGIECSDGTFMPVNETIEPVSSALLEFNSSSNPDEVGLRLQVPFGAKACGATWFGRFSNTSAAADLVLYDASMNSLASCSISAANTAYATTAGMRSCYFSSQQTLSADTTYYLMLKPTTTNGTRQYVMSYPSVNSLQSSPGSTAVYKAYRTDGGSISTTTTDKTSLSLELCSVATSSSSGGASAHTWVQ